MTAHDYKIDGPAGEKTYSAASLDEAVHTYVAESDEAAACWDDEWELVVVDGERKRKVTVAFEFTVTTEIEENEEIEGSATKSPTAGLVALAFAMFTGACDAEPEVVFVDVSAGAVMPRDGDDCTEADVDHEDTHCETRWCEEHPSALDPFPGATFRCIFKECDYVTGLEDGVCTETCFLGPGCSAW